MGAALTRDLIIVEYVEKKNEKETLTIVNPAKNVLEGVVDLPSVVDESVTESPVADSSEAPEADDLTEEEDSEDLDTPENEWAHLHEVGNTGVVKKNNLGNSVLIMLLPPLLAIFLPLIPFIPIIVSFMNHRL
jgi:ABC-type Na+ efflux pump permease subunit